MARGTGKNSSAPSEEALASIAETVRGTFQTVEDMTQSFIREAIIQGVFPPGQRLNLDTIASVLGVSRMPVRASLRQLEGEGLVRIHPYRGATVSILLPSEIAEVYELRILLESYLLERAMPNIDDAFLDRLKDIVRNAEASDELGERLDARRAMYEQIYEHADRPRALANVNTLRSSVGRYLLLQRIDEHQGHEKFIGYLEDRDLPKARAWLVAHLQKVSATLQAMVAAEQDDAKANAG